MKSKLPVEVVSKFDARGTVIPLQFTWQGRSYPVESIGRRWVNGDGQHILVMAPSGKTFELLYIHSEERWYLARSPGRRDLA